MRNEVIEQTVNDSMVTTLDYILQLIEQSNKQKDGDRDKLIQQSLEQMRQDQPSLSKADKAELEYTLYYHLALKQQPEWFQLTGELIDRFPYEQNNSSFDVYQHEDNVWGVVTQEGKKSHKVTTSFKSKEDLLLHLFGTTQFEKFRGETFWIQQNEQVFSLKENKHFRLLLFTGQSMKPFRTHKSLEKLRISILKDDLAQNPNLKKKALRQTLEDKSLPVSLMGKTVTINELEQKQDHVELTLKEDGTDHHIKLPDLEDKWMKLAKNRAALAFNELVMNSQAVAQGFLSFYGIEINQSLQTKAPDFEVISHPKGSFIGHVKSDGSIKKLSPYFTEKEANLRLGDLKKELRKEKNLEQDKSLNQEISFDDIIEKHEGG
ncbi:hypothetical protein [Fictibacillus terranigra]|uniref:Uncharacterized protein n=1 Tax=Fictibacillus terranigra TaxID=3058424 RepID=A0ABT8EC55_9BACL|nr:hypothetical protein [Fictibacillus sp. CENA-BCM004]MDN4075504.1 hypothetical protein [Fictibacillus sp. CENA-BCM004]